MGAQRELRGHGERRGAAGLGDTHGAALRSGEVEQLQLGVALQGPLQVPQLPVHPRHHRRAEPAGTARGVGRRRGRPKRGGGCRAVPQLLGHVARGAAQRQAGKDAAPGQRDADGGPLRGAASMAAPVPLLAVRFQPLEEPQPFGEVGLRAKRRMRGGGPQMARRGMGGGGSAHPVPPPGDPQQQQPPPAQRRGHGGARTAPSGAGRTLRPSPGRSSAVAASA